MTDATSPRRPALELEGLALSLGRSGAPLVTDVSLAVSPGEMVGLVGESGSGKTLTGLAISGLLPNAISVSSGRLRSGTTPWQQLRDGGRQAGIAMVFQNPATSLNPSMTVGRQLAEAYRIHHPGRRRAAVHAEVVDLLGRVRLPDPRRCARSYPHQLSGGMKQRVMIAMALACEPEVVIADEPTTALDVSVQREVMDDLDRMRQEEGVGILLISHDIALVGERCNRVLVMYAGELVETGSAQQVLTDPRHPYVHALLACTPERCRDISELRALPGRVPQPGDVARGCRFADRCARREPACEVEDQHLTGLGPDRSVRCRVAVAAADRSSPWPPTAEPALERGRRQA